MGKILDLEKSLYCLGVAGMIAGAGMIYEGSIYPEIPNSLRAEHEINQALEDDYASKIKTSDNLQEHGLEAVLAGSGLFIFGLVFKNRKWLYVNPSRVNQQKNK